MEDVPALLTHCFGKKTVPSEFACFLHFGCFKLSQNKCVCLCGSRVWCVCVCVAVQVRLRRTCVQRWLYSTPSCQITLHSGVDSVRCCCSREAPWSSRSARARPDYSTCTSTFALLLNGGGGRSELTVFYCTDVNVRCSGLSLYWGK